jgi:hypothetical protein
MAQKMGQESTINHVKKRTTIGRGRLKMSSMNKHKRRNYKAYNGQGRAK